MRKGIKFLASAIMILSVVACSSVSKMAEMAANVKVTCNPEVLQVVGGHIDADLTVTYPKGYFNKRAILEVTPVLVYEGGEAAMAPFMYQGTKVKDNYKVISSDGQTVKERVHFNYVKGMEKATLELRGVVKYKDKSLKLPVKRVAVGCNTTYMLAETNGSVSYKKDNYQDIINQTAEGQILYNINSANVSGKELRSSSIKDFKEALQQIENDGRKTLKSTEIIAYASPDGGKKLNDKLSNKRASTADRAWKKVTKGENVVAPEISSVGQDWEGFQELVRKSNIQDKDLILRVLSMYSDPAVRENEIKNMSEIYTALKKSVLPELRRARFIANVEFKNYNSNELLKLVEQNSDVLDEEALLRAASLVKNLDDKVALYQKAINKYNSDRAKFNLGVVLLNQGKVDEAADEFAKVQTKDADLDNAMGVIALRKGDLKTAENYFKKADTKEAKLNLGVIAILQGEYQKAAEILSGTHSANEAVTYLLINEPGKVIDAFSCACPRSDYIRAVAAARLGKTQDVAKYLKSARRCPALKDRMLKDVEFAKYNIVLK